MDSIDKDIQKYIYKGIKNMIVIVNQSCNTLEYIKIYPAFERLADL